jgi:hypothetical protein
MDAVITEVYNEQNVHAQRIPDVQFPHQYWRLELNM